MNIINKLSEILFSLLNYLVMIIIILALIFVVRWRLNHLFAANIEQDPTEISIIDEINQNKEALENITAGSEDDVVESEILAVEYTEVTIPENPTAEVVAEALLSQGLIEDTYTFVEQTKNLGVSEYFIPGTFQFPADYKVADIIEDLTAEKKNALTQQVYVNISEEATTEDVADLLLHLNLIQDKITFINQVNEMGLDNQFIPGEHIIVTPIKVADMINILCGQS